MTKRRSIITITVLVSFLLSQHQVSNAWQTESGTTDFGDKQFILSTYFVSGVGAYPTKRPAGAHKQLDVVCTASYFEIGFFDISASGDLLVIGSPKTMKVKFDGKLDPLNVAVNTKKGSSYVEVNNPKALFAKLKAAKNFAVEMTSGSGFYRAIFDVKDLLKYKSSLSGAGCKL
jgi:hypothetical protein